jgi:hypothetical protein
VVCVFQRVVYSRSSPALPPPYLRIGQALALVAVALLYRPYCGIIHDSKVYVGHALAVLNPQSVGRDLMFTLDGQSNFSVFPRLLTFVVAGLGASSASIVLTLLGLGVWLAAASALVRQLVRSPAFWATMVCVLVLPQTYGSRDILGYGEAFVTPRPFAEAAVLAGLAAILARRKGLGLALLGLAGAFHPILGLAGIGVALVLLVSDDRRWLWLPAISVAGLLAAIGLGVPLVTRLTALVDPDWLEALRQGKDYLFPDLWVPRDFMRIGLQLTTLLIAASQTSGRPRTLFLAVGAVGLAGLAATWLFADLLPSLLMLQLQPWRALWLLAVFGNASLPVAALALWRLGTGYRLVLGSLAAAWLLVDVPPLAALALCGAVILFVLARADRSPVVSPPLATLLLGGLVLLAGLWLAFNVSSFVAFYASALGAGAPTDWQSALATDFPRLPVAAAAIALTAAPVLPGRAVTIGATLVLLLVAVAIWDQRSPMRRAIDEGEGSEALVQLLREAPGEVLWLDGDTQAWLLARRPNWSILTQGAGAVFSRPLQQTWHGRMAALVDLGLQDGGVLTPYKTPYEQRPSSSPPSAGIAAICRRPDGPAAVVLPGPPPPGLPSRVWRAPQPDYAFYQDRGPAWRRIDSYAVVLCRDLRL